MRATFYYLIVYSGSDVHIIGLNNHGQLCTGSTNAITQVITNYAVFTSVS